MWRRWGLVYIVIYALVLFSGCRKEEEEECQFERDYVIAEEADVIIPPSGEASAWIYIIGGNLRGTRYVAPWGNDNNDGSLNYPWRTLAYAVIQLHPGDTLVVLPDSGRTRPIIAGRNNVRAAFDLSGKSYLWIENLEITHYVCGSGESIYFRDGIEILNAPAHHIVLKDLYINHIDEYGMNFRDVDSIQILGCRIEYCGFGAMGGPAADSGGWRNVLIRGCSLSYSGHYYQGRYSSRYDPARPYDRPDGFGIEESEGPIIIEKTIASHNYGDGIDSKAHNTTVSQCIVENNSCDGVKLWGDHSKVVNTLIYGRGDGDNTHTPWAVIAIDQVERANSEFEIVNCTIDDQLGYGYVIYIQYDGTVPVRVTMKNCIISSWGLESPIFVRGNATFIAENNLFYFPNCERVLEYGDSTYTRNTIVNFGSSNLYGDPLFVKTAWGQVGDYHLRDGSPAIDHGTSNGAPSVDLEDHTRPQGNGYDIGCCER
ncbi:MAG: right-handed parallel beta-helix repeat-containing protein [Candidatus Hydrothermia bacterium]